MVNMIDKVIGKNRTLKHITRDSDRDNVPNIFDCKPYDPNKQGLIHDLVERSGEKLYYKSKEGSFKEKVAFKLMDSAREKRAESEKRKEYRAEVREAKRESFQKERLIVARERGKRMARPRTSFRGFVSGIARSSPIGLPRASPLSKGKKGKRPKTMRDVLGGNIPKFF